MSPPFILALDLSKKRTGVCEGFAGEAPRFHSIEGGDLSNADAAKQLGLWLIDRTKIDKPACVYIEAAISPAAFIGKVDEETKRVKMSSNPKTTLALAGMASVARFVLDCKNIPVREAHVSTVRKAFIGHGNLNSKVAKLQVLRMCKALGWSPRNDDEADAGAVWWYACTQFAPKFYQPITPMLQQKVASSGVLGGQNG
jgi:hypothetical protein